MVAALIAFSRMYMFLHYPTDVLCGMILGILLGIASLYR
ncbi:MAG: phosphatase PAP2 family protein [Lachnospiraceae bacterium]|nr:phosphatase PAP2 family protein [Lachnospiraceae bacterium]